MLLTTWSRSTRSPRHKMQLQVMCIRCLWQKSSRGEKNSISPLHTDPLSKNKRSQWTQICPAKGQEKLIKHLSIQLARSFNLSTSRRNLLHFWSFYIIWTAQSYPHFMNFVFSWQGYAAMRWTGYMIYLSSLLYSSRDTLQGSTHCQFRFQNKWIGCSSLALSPGRYRNLS